MFIMRLPATTAVARLNVHGSRQHAVTHASLQGIMVHLA